jgi:hypothetical protein
MVKSVYSGAEEERRALDVTRNNYDNSLKINKVSSPVTSH